MKILVIAVASVVGAIASPAFAAYDRYGNYISDSRDAYRQERGVARVIESNPVYAASGTREECWNPREGRFQDRSESRLRWGLVFFVHSYRARRVSEIDALELAPAVNDQNLGKPGMPPNTVAKHHHAGAVAWRIKCQPQAKNAAGESVHEQC